MCWLRNKLGAIWFLPSVLLVYPVSVFMSLNLPIFITSCPLPGTPCWFLPEQALTRAHILGTRKSWGRMQYRMKDLQETEKWVLPSLKKAPYKTIYLKLLGLEKHPTQTQSQYFSNIHFLPPSNIFQRSAKGPWQTHMLGAGEALDTLVCGAFCVYSESPRDQHEGWSDKGHPPGYC